MRNSAGDEEQINPGHRQVRSVLRILGPVIIGAGALLTAIGLISFFTAFGTFSPPRYFWCAILGLPLTGVGIAITRVAYLGAIFRFLAGEAAPVQKDTFNYVAQGIRPGVRDLARSVSEGWRSGFEGANPDGEQFCTQCGAAAGLEAQFCSRCGAKLAHSNSA